MDRRNFLKAVGMTTVAAAFSEAGLQAESLYEGKSKESLETKALHIRFLGTGAADWKGPDIRGEHRRLSSILLDNRILIDYTATAEDMIPEGCKPEAIFYTHSHKDHFQPEDLLRLGVPKVYVSVSWLPRAWQEFAKAHEKTGLPVPEVLPLNVAEHVVCGNICITPLPANHSTSDIHEQTQIFLIEKGAARVLYATDTGGIMGVAARISGIDPHVKDGRAITGLIMEATMGMGDKGDEDFRIFQHSSVNTVLRSVRMLSNYKRYLPEEGQYVYLTHLARTLHGTQAELDADLPSPLKAAYDGLEVLFKA